MFATVIRGGTARFLFALEDADGAPITGATLPVRVVHANAPTVALATGNATQSDSTNLPGVYHYDYTVAANQAYGNILAHANASAISGASVERLNTVYNVSQQLAYLDAAVSSVGGASAADIAAAVWNRATLLHLSAGTFGRFIQDMVAYILDTQSLFGDISLANPLSAWLLALASDSATMPTELSNAGYNNATDSLEAIRNRGDADWAGGGGAAAEDVWTYADRTLTSVDGGVNVVNPFDRNTARITIGYGEDRSTGSTNGALALTTTTDINLSTAGGTIYFAVRQKNTPATSAAAFTLTGTATAALAYTVSLTSATTRSLLPGTYLWTAWHVVGGVYTDLGHGDYVVADLVTPTV